MCFGASTDRTKHVSNPEFKKLPPFILCVVFQAAKPAAKKAEAKKPASNMFDDSEDEDDMFGDAPAKKAEAKQAEPKAETGSLFDSEASSWQRGSVVVWLPTKCRDRFLVVCYPPAVREC